MTAHQVFSILRNLDRRWIFLLMGLAVGIPILLQLDFPEKPGKMALDVFNEIENLEEGDKVLMAWDYDPSTEGELGPMAMAFARHCCEKKVKLYFVSLLPVGPTMIDKTINDVIKADFPDMVYGQDYVNLGYKSGYEGVIKVIVTDLRGLYTTDAAGTNIDQIPMCRDVESVQDMDLIVNVSGAYPGSKEWVQYAVTPYQGKIRMVAGCTGVQSTLLFPYVPEQLNGLLGAIKGGAEYEAKVTEVYIGENPPAKYQMARQRMGPQHIAHLLMVFLIVLGNVVYFTEGWFKKESPQQPSSN
ncbi:MAG: hypothetical protein KDA69_12010 [Planctomycetaceae bacterium]|nr:hypothetical protein [Planctomycetaceae bacterium]MCA9031336.1 hypothetical protein [Planctomycetaceae bacterium]MCA9045041.1 hypothetical protein [Planctomycetaceae bacterium]MCB9951520.1 hypothetical protein [Planctomycetaceae bacterium]